MSFGEARSLLQYYTELHCHTQYHIVVLTMICLWFSVCYWFTVSTLEVWHHIFFIWYCIYMYIYMFSTLTQRFR